MPSTGAQPRRTRLLQFESEEFREKFPFQPFKIRHHLADQPELQLPQLIELARRMPEGHVEYYSGDVGVNQDRKTYPKNGLSVVETVRRIEECGSWMVLKNIGIDSEYRGLIRRILDEVYGHFDSDPPVRDIYAEKGFIFISSPHSVTPYHLDDEHNFLLQVRGSKQVSMWDPKDRNVMPETQAEYMMELWHPEDWQRYMPYEEKFQERASVFQLSPGEGLHFPFGAPHWVKNGPEVSISFSTTFLSNLSKRQATLYYLNRRLRRLGLQPTPPDQSKWRDSMKLGAYNTVKQATRTFIPASPKQGKGA